MPSEIMRYWLGLDLGQASDYTALAILRQRWTLTAPVSALEVPYLRRFPLGTPYPEIVAEVTAICGDPRLAGCYRLIPDATGVGRPVVDLLRRARLMMTPISITGGATFTMGADGTYRVPKMELVSCLQVALQNRRLKFAKRLPEISTLVDEILAFRVKITAAGNEQAGSWREGSHDDMVLAVAMAAWLCDRETGFSRNPTPASISREQMAASDAQLSGVLSSRLRLADQLLLRDPRTGLARPVKHSKPSFLK